jgi:small subunit ribosomal protein S19
MIRSSKKGPYISYSLFKKINKLNLNLKKDTIKTWSRSSMILPNMIGNIISIYNGKKHIPIYITDSMVGYKLGEFASTRSFKTHKKGENKIKNKIYDKK